MNLQRMAIQQKIAAVLAAEYSDVTEENAQATLDMLSGALDDFTSFVEDRLSDIAVKYELYVSLGDYGSGRSVIVNESQASNYGMAVGDWLSSSSTC